MPIDPDTHRLWYDYYFTPLHMGRSKDDQVPRYTIKVKADGYQQCVSISSFLHGVRNKKKGHDVKTHYKYDPDGAILWIGKEESDFRFEQELDGKRADLIATFDNSTEQMVEDTRNYHPDPELEFDNVFDFYKHIGYDYKKKRFTR